MKKLILIFTLILAAGVSLAFAGDYREVIFGNSYTNINGCDKIRTYFANRKSVK